MVESKKNIQETLKKQWKRMIISAIVVFLIVFWRNSTSYDKPTSIAVVKAFLQAAGVLLVYYFLISDPSKFQKRFLKIIIIGWTASAVTLGMVGFLKLFDLITKEHRFFIITLLAVTFIIGLYVGKLLVEKTKLRWWVG